MKMLRHIALWFAALSMLAVPLAQAATDQIAQQQANAAKAVAAAASAKQPPLFDGSIVFGPGDSITANSNGFDTTPNGSNTWTPKGSAAMMVAFSGGRIRPVDITGWPYTGSGVTTTGFGELIVADPGNGQYSSGTTCAVQSGVGVTGATCSVTIVNGVPTNPIITNPGTGYLGQAPMITLTDPAGTGSGAVILAQVAKAGAFAAGGIGTSEAKAYIPRILNNGSPIARNVLMAIGTNDQARGIPLATSQANIVWMAQQLVAGGVRPIVVAVLTRTGAAGANAQSQASALRRWEITTLPTLVPGVIVLDPSPCWTDAATNSTAAPISTTNATDGLHPTFAGATLLGKCMSQQAAPIFTAAPLLSDGSNGDLYNATYNPQGNLLSVTGATLIAGTTATPNATTEAPWTGTRYANVFLSRVAGGTCTGTFVSSLVPRSDGRGGNDLQLQVNATGCAAGETLRLTWSGNGVANTLDVAPSVGGATLNEGDRIVATVDEVVMSNVTNMKGLKLKLIGSNISSGYPITPTAANVVSGRTGTSAWGDYEDVNFPAFSGEQLWLQTRQMVIPAGTARLTMCMEFVINAAGAASFTVKLGGASVRKVTTLGALDLPRLPANDDAREAQAA